MQLIKIFIDFILHLDRHLGQMITLFGPWTYIILFLIIFAETGLVIAPFLPGDSLLFAAGAFAGVGLLNVWVIYFSLLVAAIAGDALNYWIGKKFESLLLEKKKLVRKEHLEKTRKFFGKYGPKAIVLARFVPIVRTLAPFVAGIGKMKYSKFAYYNVFGGFIWVTLFVWGGYFFGNIPIVKDNFSVVIIGIIIASFMPILVEWIKHKREKNKK
jgi:membrane-associated protein